MSNGLFYLCGMTDDLSGGIYGYTLKADKVLQQQFKIIK